ncbi:glycosyltransferase family 2 protein [Mixia osmundae IAM 14324]|uniref:Glycosyltransferase 2-like domain-containing protein n=1 Tax=Mixia osmundae (strain CBS 9802 / IAM 14324 / JCM 22182 / KY 12970) TaxID=764103 RepID=G7DUU7_MIXOS|nr:glycosyltransferase family 2 protein [Mixia osmundae IAM 14324]KEI37425.1 glycosyltransferase family 2 protein [Mixia osmundae IAM 14324]GAA94357.1 hypothetical protein E5Q_01008 [Mixia osmundae IAM 14324]
MLYLTSDHLPVFVPLGVIGFYRYLWFVIRLLAWASYRPIPLPAERTYTPERDVTIIVPTIDTEQSLARAALTWLANRPYQIIIVTENSRVEAMQEMAGQIQQTWQHVQSSASAAVDIKPEADGKEPSTQISVLSIDRANKRLQMAHGIAAASTDIVVFSDDDALWPRHMLDHILACFEHASIGGVGTSQVVKSVGNHMTVWEVLAAFRLSIRNIEISASTHIDGGVPCLSGRTAAYRTEILKDPEFLREFTNELWLGKYPLNSGDDKFLTRWMVSHGWKTYVQCSSATELQSTMRPDWRFLKQVLRWTRNTWRSDFKSVFVERYIWSRHPYTTYTMIDKFLNPVTLWIGPCLVIYLCIKSKRDPGPDAYHLPTWNILISYLVWLHITRTAKLIPHLYRHPTHLIYVPVWLIFGYYFAAMKIYALFTLHEVAWGTRHSENDDAAPQSVQLAHELTASEESPIELTDTATFRGI